MGMNRPTKKPRGVKSEYISGLDLLTQEINRHSSRKELEEKETDNKTYSEYLEDDEDANEF